MAEIIVLGSLNMDLTFDVDKLPSMGETVMARKFIKNPGGKGANQAVAAAGYGAKVKMISRVGQDQYGEELLSAIYRRGVDISGIVKDNESPTGTAFITVEKSGLNTIIVYPGANGNVAYGDFIGYQTELPETKALIAQLEIPANTVREAFILAQKHSVMTVLNPSPIDHMERDLLKVTDCIVLNEVEAATITGLKVTDSNTAQKAAVLIRQDGPKQVVLTLGDQGAVYSGSEGEFFIPAYPVVAVDSTGAGDTFIAVFVAALLDGKKVKDSLSIAAAAGAITASRKGALIALPNRDEIEEFLHDKHQKCQKID